MAKFKFLGLDFDSYSIDEVINRIEELIKNKKPAMVFTPNAELIVRANKTSDLKMIYDKADILTIDSWVVYYAARILGHKLKEPASAAHIMFRFLPIIEEKGYKIYLLGATKEVVELVNNNLLKKYPNIKIVGYHDGYFDKNAPEAIAADIKSKQPDILFLGMSTPYKENFVYYNINNMEVPVSLGVGGSFDILAGRCDHAPIWISKIGLEWFYRFIQEPTRLWKRYLVTHFLFIHMFLESIFIKRKP